MSVVAELLAELSNLLSSLPGKEKSCEWSSPVASAPALSTVSLEERALFLRPDGSAVELNAGEYQVTILPEGHFLLASTTERLHWFISAKRTWHPFNLTSLLVLNVHTDGVQNIMALFPGGGALLAMGSQEPTPAGTPGPKSIEAPVVLEAILKWSPPQWPARRVPFNERLLLPPSLFGWGQINPDPSPARFAPMVTPPNWVSATVATCSAPGGCPFTPGDPALRGPFAGYVTSVTSVTVSSVPVIRPGWIVQLLVTSMVSNVGNITMMVSTWTDVYQIISPAAGPVVFPGVILATGRAASNAQFSTWVPDAEESFTTSPGTGVPVQFELRIGGITFATRTCLFNAQYYYPETTAGPVLTCQ
jgi:hypothetical protein